jgi:8-oxo-dGTP diphosphatase
VSGADPRPALTVDAFIRDPDGRVLLVRRGRPPFAGQWALPGGFVEYGETTEAACAREALEETGLSVLVERLLGVYSDPQRDPRGHTVGILYACRFEGGSPRAGDDAAEARFFEPADLARLPLAFDHRRILEEHVPELRPAIRRSP